MKAAMHWALDAAMIAVVGGEPQKNDDTPPARGQIMCCPLAEIALTRHHQETGRSRGEIIVKP